MRRVHTAWLNAHHKNLKRFSDIARGLLGLWLRQPAFTRLYYNSIPEHPIAASYKRLCLEVELQGHKAGNPLFSTFKYKKNGHPALRDGRSSLKSRPGGWRLFGLTPLLRVVSIPDWPEHSVLATSSANKPFEITCNTATSSTIHPLGWRLAPPTDSNRSTFPGNDLINHTH